VYFTTVAFLPLLQKASEKRGKLYPSVIVISSMSGIMRHAQGHFSYNAAKGATVHLTKLMSAEFQKLDIRVNSIAPGYFPSEMTTKESDEDQKSHLPDETVQEKGHVPMARGGTDEEMAMAIVSESQSSKFQEAWYIDVYILSSFSQRTRTSTGR
jgi:NAD(P)-dependent dehydrogenase (short-subunit alcohol dehydrogenase family)